MLNENVIRIIDEVIDDLVCQTDLGDGYREYIEQRRIILKYIWENYIAVENVFFDVYLYLPPNTNPRTYKMIINDIIKEELFQKLNEYEKQDFINVGVINRIKILYYMLLTHFEEFDKMYGIERRAL